MTLDIYQEMIKKILTYNGVFVQDRHDLKNHPVSIAVHDHIFPRFKFNQDKEIVIVYTSERS